MRLGLLVFLSALLVSRLGNGQQNAAVPPDTIFFNGKVITVDAGFTVQQAFAVKGDSFVAVGSNRTVRALAGNATRLIDLHGSSVIPGLTDNHDHVYDSAKVLLRGLSLDGTASVTEALDRIRQGVTRARPGESVFTSALRLPQGQPGLTKKDLDQISTE